MRYNWRVVGCMVFFLALMVIGRWRVMASFEWRYPALNELVTSENYAGDVGTLFLGAHRLAADIAYIQFLQYYGVPEVDSDQHHESGHPHDHYGGGVYPELQQRALRYLRLDPFFNGAILEAAGALAFNVQRGPEALDYLKEAIDRDPTYYRYHLYVTAILFKKLGQEEKLIDKLLEAIQYPDCPTLLQGVLGNLLKKYGRFEEAAKVYLHTYQTTADLSEKHLAGERLETLLREHPEVTKSLGLSLK